MAQWFSIKRGHDFRRPVMDAFRRVAIDQHGVGIAAGDRGDLG
jgi:hypothetical protein